MLNQSSGHGKMQEGSLNINSMSAKFGGKQEKLRNTKIQEIDPYWGILRVRDEQLICFCDDDMGPFYLNDNHQLKQKHDRKTGQTKLITKSKVDLEKIKGQGMLCERAL